MDKHIAGVERVLMDAKKISEHWVSCPALGKADPGI